MRVSDENRTNNHLRKSYLQSNPLEYSRYQKNRKAAAQDKARMSSLCSRFILSRIWVLGAPGRRAAASGRGARSWPPFGFLVNNEGSNGDF